MLKTSVVFFESVCDLFTKNNKKGGTPTYWVCVSPCSIDKKIPHCYFCICKIKKKKKRIVHNSFWCTTWNILGIFFLLPNMTRVSFHNVIGFQISYILDIWGSQKEILKVPDTGKSQYWWMVEHFWCTSVAWKSIFFRKWQVLPRNSQYWNAKRSSIGQHSTHTGILVYFSMDPYISKDIKDSNFANADLNSYWKRCILM